VPDDCNGDRTGPDLRYWNAVNYLTVAQIYLQANPLLREPLSADHIKPRLLGLWGTSPGLSHHVYVREHFADMPEVRN